MAPADLSSRQLQDGADISPRRLFGVYYTPDNLASLLVRWALAGGRGPVLDPSYGGCAFLEAAVRILSEMDVSTAGKRVYGVDIDPGAPRQHAGPLYFHAIHIDAYHHLFLLSKTLCTPYTASTAFDN